MERLGDRATFLGLLRQLLNLGLVDTVNVAYRRDGRGGDTRPGDELHLDGRVEPLDFVPGFAQAVGEGHRVAGRVSRGEQLFRARLAVLTLRAACPRDRKLADRFAGDLDAALSGAQVAFPNRIRSTNRSHRSTSADPDFPQLFLIGG